MAGSRPIAAPGAPTLRLAGAPSSLRGMKPTTADAGDPSPAHASHVELKSASGESIGARSASVVGGKLRVRLDPTTASGRYTGGIEVDGILQPIEIDVVETIALQIRPASIVIDLAAGSEQIVATAVENRGNVTLTIDLTGAYPLGEERPLQRADEEPAGGGTQILADLLARVGGGGRVGRALREIGEVTLSMPDGAFRLEPGASRVVEVGVAFPSDLTSTARYRAFVPLFGEDLELVAVTGAKQ